MARRYKKKGRHGKVKPSVISMVPLAVLGVRAYNGYKLGGPVNAVRFVAGSLTGYDIVEGKFNLSDPQGPMLFYGSAVGAYLGKKVVAMSGVNRAMKGLPFRL